MSQDLFYLKKEANDFFERNLGTLKDKKTPFLRASKKTILDNLSSHIRLEKCRVLEVGCFIGDLLFALQRNHRCSVVGVETSSKACALAKKVFKLNLENSYFSGSRYFSLASENRAKFDLIIFDDVLSWMGRETIFQVLAVSDWLLQTGGAIYFRDFAPAFSFCFKNHHQKHFPVFNFKQSGGHKKMFLEYGMYYEKFTSVYSSACLQKIKTSRPDSTIWADSLLIKLASPLHPLLKPY